MTTTPMTIMRNNAEIRFRVARPDQAADVLSVLDEAVAWL